MTTKLSLILSLGGICFFSPTVFAAEEVKCGVFDKGVYSVEFKFGSADPFEQDVPKKSIMSTRTIEINLGKGERLARGKDMYDLISRSISIEVSDSIKNKVLFKQTASISSYQGYNLQLPQYDLVIYCNDSTQYLPRD